MLVAKLEMMGVVEKDLVAARFDDERGPGRDFRARDRKKRRVVVVPATDCDKSEKKGVGM